VADEIKKITSRIGRLEKYHDSEVALLEDFQEHKKDIVSKVSELERYHNSRLSILESFQNTIRTEQQHIVDTLADIKKTGDKIHRELMVDDKDGDSLITQVKSIKRSVDILENERQTKIQEHEDEAKDDKRNKRRTIYKVVGGTVILAIGWLFSKAGVDKIFFKLIKLF